ncbi:prolyl oligopeptidase family serine peptidase [Melioribacter sp. OK-6-Me]|uniref:alpha/beta hydrolase family protein n=1 Tax=unclassified Melioribacter TaxID=2627329 RepID=UPI003ED9408F
MKIVTKVILILTIVAVSVSAQKRAMTVEDLWSMKRIGSFDLSPDGSTIAFDVTTYDIDQNKGNTDIYLINSDGTNLRPLKVTSDNESNPKFSPDGNSIAYEYKGQIWICDLNGANERQLTDIYTGASGMIWSKDGRKILFVSEVNPDCPDQNCNEQRDKEKEASKVKARIITELMFRSWNRWRDEKRSHLFLYDLDKNEYYDLIQGSKSDVPPVDLGSVQDYTFSPDGKEVAFVMNTDKMPAISTNNDVFVINVEDVKKGTPAPYKKISVSQGNDNQPVYSPDGKFIAFRSMKRAGFEADKQNIMIYNRASGSLTNITEKIDLSAGQIVWSPDGKYIYFDAANEIYNSIYRVNVSNGNLLMFVKDGVNNSMIISKDGEEIFFKRQKTTMPYEIFALKTNGGGIRKITDINGELLAGIEFNEPETFRSEGAEGAKVQSILIKPPFFDPNKKYPMLFLIHGGPQGHWSDDFHYRWNLQMFAAGGYVVVAPNPRGSTGYGQKFVDEISGDWGGKVYIDLMNAYDYALDNYKFIDYKNTFAAGASYGGYMINWILGHTDRFNALVCHAGVFNLESMYGTTEELWFPEWEFKGTPWTNRPLYELWSPHRYADNFKTPTLVIHGANDFRVPEGQAFELFTTLQRKGVPSKFLYFPDEYHFVTKPQNALLWWKTIFEWLDEYKK